jgi:hypothetical protein
VTLNTRISATCFTNLNLISTKWLSKLKQFRSYVPFCIRCLSSAILQSRFFCDGYITGLATREVAASTVSNNLSNITPYYRRIRVKLTCKFRFVTYNGYLKAYASILANFYQNINRNTCIEIISMIRNFMSSFLKFRK